MQCENCQSRKAEYICHRPGKKPHLCPSCLQQTRSLFCAWQRLEDYSACAEIPVSTWKKWALEILIDGMTIRTGKQIVVSRAGRKGCAKFFALENN